MDIALDVDNIFFGESESKKDIFTTIKENISLENNEHFFNTEVNNSVKIIDTGGGKTYNSAYLLLYTLFYTNKSIIFTTKENENLESFVSEVFKILKINIKNKSTEITEFLEKKELDKLGILKLTSYTIFVKDAIKNSRAIITNHHYFFSANHSTKYLRSTNELLKKLNKKDVTLLIDEIDELEKKSLIEIPMTKYYKFIENLNKVLVRRESKSCFAGYSLKYYQENIHNLRYTLPEQCNLVKYERVGTFEVPTYSISEKEGTIDVEDLIDENYKVVEELEDEGRREGFYIWSKKERKINPELEGLNFVRVEKIFRLEKKHNNQHEICKIINASHGAVVVEQRICLTYKETKNKKEDQKAESIKLQEFETREDFINYCKKNMTVEKYDSVLARIMKEGRMLYKKRLIIRRKSIFDNIKIKKHMFTATPSNLKDLGYHLEEAKTNKVNTLEFIDIFFYKRKKTIDSFIFDKSLNCFKDKDINVLSFLSLKTILNEAIDNKTIRNNDKYKNICCISAMKDNDYELKSHNFNIINNENYSNINTNVKISYLNGTESSGKNYKDTDLVIINTRHDINISARVNISKKTTITTIEDASIKTTIQACGRIERTSKNQKYKAAIMIGEDKDLIKIFIDAKKRNGIKYNLFNMTNFEKVIKNIEDKLKFYNECDETININLDKRNKFNADEIINYYKTIENTKEAKKLTIDKFGIDRSGFYKILKEYKCK